MIQDQRSGSVSRGVVALRLAANAAASSDGDELFCMRQASSPSLSNLRRQLPSRLSDPVWTVIAVARGSTDQVLSSGDPFQLFCRHGVKHASAEAPTDADAAS